MPINWSIPLDTSAIPSNINSIIAQGPQNLPQFGNLPDAFWAGENQAYKDRQQNLFRNGFPMKTDPNTGNQVPDYTAMSDMILKAGGAPAVPQAISLRGLDPSLYPPITEIDRTLAGGGAGNTNQTPSGVGGPTTSTLPPSTSGGAQPNTAQPGATASPAPGTPGGGPQDAGVTTLRKIALATNQDPATLSRNMGGIDPDTDINANDPQTRAAIVNALRGNPLNGPQQPAVQGAGPAPNVSTAQMTPPPAPQMSQPDLQRQLANENYRGSVLRSLAQRATAMGNVAQAKQYDDAAADSAKRALAIQESILRTQEPTNEMKTARDPAVIGFEKTKAAETKAATDDQEAFDKDYTGISNLGRNAAALSQRIPIAKNLTLNPNFYSGPFHEGVESYRQFQAIFGRNPTAATPMEAFNKTTNDILADQIKAMGQSGVGRVLQAEVRIMQQGIASLGITPASNRAQLEMLNRVYAQQQEYANIADQVKTRLGNVAPGQRQAALNSAIMSYANSHPLFTDQEKAHPEVLGAPDVPAEALRWTPDQVRAWAASAGLRPGDAIKINGQYAKVP